MSVNEPASNIQIYIPRQYLAEDWPRNLSADRDTVGIRIETIARVNQPIQSAIREAIRTTETELSSTVTQAAAKQEFYFETLQSIDDSGTIFSEPLTYDLEYDGSIRMSSVYERESISTQTVNELIECGYVIAQERSFVFRISEGRGGDGGSWDIVNDLLRQGIDLGFSDARGILVGWFVSKSWGKIRGSVTDRRARTVAKDWANRKIESPHQLRKWIDLKSEWEPKEIDKRLFRGKNLFASKHLLKALGFTRSSRATYTVGVSKKARRRRQKWLDAEEQNRMGS